MITEEKRLEIVRYWWSKAEDSLSPAWREFKAGSFSFAMNRLYYASFYGVSALFCRTNCHLKSIPGFVQPFINDS